MAQLDSAMTSPSSSPARPAPRANCILRLPVP